MSPRLTSLLFLLGEECHRQPRAVYKYWAPCRLFCIEVFFTVNSGRWFCHPRGTLLVLEVISGTAHTGFMGVHALPCGLDYVLFPLRLSVVLTAYGPPYLAATCSMSCRSSSVRSFLGDPFRKRSRIQCLLVRQWTQNLRQSAVLFRIPRNAWIDSGHKFASVYGWFDSGYILSRSSSWWQWPCLPVCWLR